MRFYGYKHWTLEDQPRCFNVGKGLEGRSVSKKSRNHKWHAISKRLGLRVEVCIGPVTNEEACAWEIEWIARENTFSTNHSHTDDADIGCNFTKGGDGSSGHKNSVEVSNRISVATSAAMMGHKVSEATCRKFAVILTGNKRGLGNKSNTGRTLPDEHRKRISLAMKKLRAIQRFHRASRDWFVRGSK